MLALRNDEYTSAGFSYDGLFIHDVLGAPMLLLSPGGDWGTFADGIRNHELAHYVNHLYINLSLQPKWLSEGIATYAESIRYDEATGLVEIGHPPKGYEYPKYVEHGHANRRARGHERRWMACAKSVRQNAVSLSGNDGARV